VKHFTSRRCPLRVRWHGVKVKRGQPVSVSASSGSVTVCLQPKLSPQERIARKGRRRKQIEQRVAGLARWQGLRRAGVYNFTVLPFHRVTFWFCDVALPQQISRCLGLAASVGVRLRHPRYPASSGARHAHVTENGALTCVRASNQFERVTGATGHSSTGQHTS
jgi:hypothetical protein